MLVIPRDRPGPMNLQTDKSIEEVAVIVPVSERYDDVRGLYHAYKNGLETAGLRSRFMYVLDGDFPEVLSHLHQLKAEKKPRLGKLGSPISQIRSSGHSHI